MRLFFGEYLQICFESSSAGNAKVFKTRQKQFVQTEVHTYGYSCSYAFEKKEII